MAALSWPRLGDGTLRWYDARDGKERLALFVHPDAKRWVLFTPEGFYDASPDAESLIGYQLNQRPRQRRTVHRLRSTGQSFQPLRSGDPKIGWE